MAKEWIRDAHNEARAEASSRNEVEKSLGALKQKKQELATKLTVEDRARTNVEAGLKNIQDQTENQCKKLYFTEIELATQKQLVLDLKADLEKAKAATQMAKEASKASKQASYLIGVEEIEIRLAEVYKDYCKVTWVEALNLAGVHADSEWRQPQSIYYHPKIREISTAFPPPSTLAPESSEQPLTIQATLHPLKASKGLSQDGNQGQGAEVTKDKGKETKPRSEAKDAAVEAKSKKADPEAKDASASQPSKKEDSPPPKAKA